MLDILQYEFMRNAMMAGVLASIVCGIVGPFIVVKRIVFISGGISHTTFGGVGLGYLLGFNPIVGAAGFAVAAAMGVGLISRYARQREDTVIGIIWSIGMALGVIFIGLSPGYAPDLFGYLFGNILTVPFGDLVNMMVLSATVFLVVALFYRQFVAVSFDEDFASIVGLRVERLNILMLVLIALAVVVLIRVVGVTLVIALLTLPAAISVQHTHNLKIMMLFSTMLGIIFSIGGLLLSYAFNLASGATIVLVAGTAFFISSMVVRLERKAEIEFAGKGNDSPND